MSKITFRADDDLIDRLEEFDASKSEVMREALRSYLDEHGESGRLRQTASASASSDTSAPDEGSLDDIIAERVDELVAERVERAHAQNRAQDINVNIALDGDSAVSTSGERTPSDTATEPTDGSSGVSHGSSSRKTPPERDDDADAGGRKTCGQCGSELSSQHVYCPNCGEKAARRVFCDCGDELRSDWSFCPGCGRRTPAADVLDGGGPS